jgi:thiosulfate dehydrogenase [quinone] large subunit
MGRQSLAATRGASPHDPAVLHNLLSDVRFAPLWLAPRLFLGWFSLDAGWRHLRNLPVSADPSGLAAIALTLCGVALILGALTGPSAFLAGCLSAGLWAGVPLAPLHFAVVVLMVLTWKTAGWIGLDRWLLPLLGLPWQGGLLFGRGNASGSETAGGHQLLTHSE